MKNFIKFLLVLPFFAFADEDPGMHDHAQMKTMNQDHQSMKHNPPPIGVMGNMHHQGFMLSIRHGDYANGRQYFERRQHYRFRNS